MFWICVGDLGEDAVLLRTTANVNGVLALCVPGTVEVLGSHYLLWSSRQREEAATINTSSLLK